MKKIKKSLNQSQIEKLNIFITDQKFGKLIEEAINTWKFTGIAFGYFGIDWNNSSKIYKICSDNCCCLVGASLIGKEITLGEEAYDVMTRLYNLSKSEIDNLWKGFDNVGADISHEILISNDYKIGNQIRKIVLDED